MFTAVTHKNLGDAESYFDEHLSQNDYYAAGEIRPGQWIGAGAERLGLKGEGTREQFHALCENQYPETGERLTQRQLKEGQRRVFYDFTCSAPKSVSVLAVTLADERLVTAHEEARRIAFHELETFAATRVRKQGGRKDRTTGNLVAGAFTHTSSRALDPQLHTHFTVFNATFDDRERSWKALQAGGMYDARARPWMKCWSSRRHVRCRRSISSNFTSASRADAMPAACSLMMSKCCARTSHVPARGWRRWKLSRPSTTENSSLRFCSAVIVS